MAFSAHVLQVLIASPGDTREERDAVEQALHGWNSSRARREQVILLPRRWESDAVPRLGGSGQSVINSQLVDEADVVVALFDSRLGMATPDAVSGTAEEIQRAHESGKPVHVWFSDEPIPRDVDRKQLAELDAFKAALEPLGLLGTYSSPEDLAFRVRQAIEHDLELLQLGLPAQRQIAGQTAVLRARCTSEDRQKVDSKGRVSISRSHKLVIANRGQRTAENVALEIAPDGDGRAPHVIKGEETPSLLPDSEIAWPLSIAMGTSPSFTVVMSWQEQGQDRTERQDISIY